MCSSKLHIWPPWTIEAGVKFILDKVKWNEDKKSSTGDYSAATVEGQDSIAIVTGKNSCAKGTLGNWLVLTERDERGHILGVKAVKVDNDNIKPDTWYWLKDEIIEWKE